jgi:hypothetical protein
VIVGLTGHAGAGKDTVAQMMVDRGAVRVGLADPVKQGVTLLNPDVADLEDSIHGYVVCDSVQDLLIENGWDGVDVHDPGLFLAWDVVKRRYPRTRALLQRFGTDVCRSLFGDGIWLELAGRRVAAADAQIVVVPDIRFDNEAAWVRDHGGVLIHVIRPGVGPINGHASDALDWLRNVEVMGIVNSGTLDELRATVDDLVDAWLEPVVAAASGVLVTSGCRPLLCPDCRAGKHGNCTNQTWCIEHDHEVECPCEDVSH